MPDKLTIRFNASAAKESACLLRTWRTVIEGYAESAPTNDVVFGSAVHEYIKHMRLTGGNCGVAMQKALAVFNKPKRTKEKKAYLNNSSYLMLCCQNLWEDYLQQDDFETLVSADGVPLVELKFSIPYYADDTVEVYLEGTIDDLCKHRAGCYAVRDYKTTSVWDKTGYLAGYALSPQLMFYRMAIEWYAKEYPGSIYEKFMSKGIPGAFVDGIFLAGADKPVTFARSEIFQFSEDKMAEFRNLLDKKIHDLLKCVNNKYKSSDAFSVPREGMLNGACQTVYGACKFFNVCNALDDIHAEHLLRNNFVQKPYNPLDYDAI